MPAKLISWIKHLLQVNVIFHSIIMIAATTNKTWSQSVSQSVLSLSTAKHFIFYLHFRSDLRPNKPTRAKEAVKFHYLWWLINLSSLLQWREHSSLVAVAVQPQSRMWNIPFLNGRRPLRVREHQVLDSSMWRGEGEWRTWRGGAGGQQSHEEARQEREETEWLIGFNILLCTFYISLYWK